jgi:hypothetical protein
LSFTLQAATVKLARSHDHHNTYKDAATSFYNQPKVLFSFIGYVDKSSTHLASVCCAIERR